MIPMAVLKKRGSDPEGTSICYNYLNIAYFVILALKTIFSRTHGRLACVATLYKLSESFRPVVKLSYKSLYLPILRS